MWYKALGDANHDDTTPQAVTVSIYKATPSYTVPTGLTATYGQTLSTVALPSGWRWANGSASVGSAGTHSFQAVYTPGNTANYNTVSGVSVSVTVGKAEPSYTVPTGLTAVYGQTLSSVALPSGWAWADPSAEVGGTGTHSFQAVYIPGDTDNYNTVSGVSVSVTVGKAEPSYTVPTGLTAVYGQKLSDVALPSGWAWADATAAVGNAGTNTFKATFTPADPDNYNTVPDVDVTVTVSKVPAPVLTDTQKPAGSTGLIQDGSPQPLVTAPAELPDGYTVEYSTDGGENWSGSVPTGADAGEYTVKVRYVGDGNHEDFQGADISVSIRKPGAEIAAPPAAKTGLIATGEAQPLLSAGEAAGGTPQYALGTDGETAPEGGWSESIPTGADPGTYYVWYKAAGDASHSDSEPVCVPVQIAPAAPDPAVGLGFVDFPAEKFKAAFTDGGTAYEISAKDGADFDGGKISAGSDLGGGSALTYYLRVAENEATGAPASAPVPFRLVRPNAPGEGLFTVLDASEQGNDGGLRLNDPSLAGKLEYRTGDGAYAPFPAGGEITGLAGGVTVSVRYSSDETGGVLNSPENTWTIRQRTSELQGVTVTGTTKYGETLTAEPTGSDGAPTGVTYQWYRVDGGAETPIPDATGSTYTLGAADIGYSVLVKATQREDTMTSPATALVTPADGSAVKPSVTVDKTDTTITVTAVPEDRIYEYSVDGGRTWQDGNSFTELTPSTPYSVVVREKAVSEGGTVTVDAGTPSNPVTVTTEAEALTLSGVTVRNLNAADGGTETVVCGQTLQAVVTQHGSSGQDYTTDSGVSYQWYRDSEPIPGATDSSYNPGGADVGKKLRVVVTKDGDSSEEATDGAVTKAPALGAPALTAGNISHTDTTVTVDGFKNNEAKGIVYEYAVVAKGVSPQDADWQTDSVFTGLTPGGEYDVYVRVKGTEAREASHPSAALTVTLDDKPLPFNEGVQTPSVVLASYAYGTTPPAPSLNVEPNSGATVTYYWQRSGFASTDTAETAGTAWTADKPTAVGTYYIRAVVSGDNYATYITGQTVFKVEKAPTGGSVTGVTVDNSTLQATVTRGDTSKKLEYTVLAGGETLSGAGWMDVTPDRNGKFPIGVQVEASKDYTVYVREKETDTTLPSAPVKGSFTPVGFTVAYDANGGAGSVPATRTYTGSAPVDTATRPTRTGYDFLGWNPDRGAAAAMTATTLTSGTTLYAVWNAHTYSVSFGDSAVGGLSDVPYGSAFVLPVPTDSTGTRQFVGWAKTAGAGTPDYPAGQLVKNLTAADGGTVPLYAVWAENTGSVSGTVKSSEGESITVRVMRGDTQWGETVTIALDPDKDEPTVYAGQFAIPDVPYGLYNLVLTQTVPDGRGGAETLTKTILIEVKGETLSLTDGQLTMPASTRSLLKVMGADTPPAVVDGLDALAKDEAVDARDVTVTMTVEKQEEQAVSQNASAAEKATQTAIEEIKERVQRAAGRGDVRELDFLNIDITKEITHNGVTESTEAITDTASYIEIILPYTKPGTGTLRLWYYHDNTPAEITTARDGVRPYYTYLNGLIHLFTRQFSTYAISYTENDGGSGGYGGGSGGYGGGSGGGGGGGTTTYAVNVNSVTHGTVKSDRTSAAAGAKVVLTATPDTGYKLESITATDSSGKEVKLTENSDGTYSFTMPSSKVTVKAVFTEGTNETEKPGYATCKHDAACPLVSFTDLNADAWYHDGIHYALENGIMNGTGGGKFEPSKATTRAMIVTMLWRMEGEPEYHGTLDFTDMEDGAWYTGAIRWAASEGIVNGYDETTFGPNDSVTREQLATILYRYAQSKGEGFRGSWMFLLDFPDAGDVSEWADEAMHWMVMNGIINGMGNGTLNPGGEATRAQVATMLMRYTALNTKA